MTVNLIKIRLTEIENYDMLNMHWSNSILSELPTFCRPAFFSKSSDFPNEKTEQRRWCSFAQIRRATTESPDERQAFFFSYKQRKNKDRRPHEESLSFFGCTDRKKELFQNFFPFSCFLFISEI